MDGDSHGGASSALVQSFSQAHDDLRTAERPAMSPAGVTQMEAAAQVHDVRLGIMPPMHNQLLLAAEAHERNRSPRVRVRDPQSD